MKIGFYIQWDKFSLTNKGGNVIGDELVSESLCRALKTFEGVEDAQVYAPNYMPSEKLDFMIYMHNIEPIEGLAQKNLIYMQNGFGEGSDYVSLLSKHKYDGYIFFSQKLLDLHKSQGGWGIFLPFGVDINEFKPEKYDKDYDFEVSYIGNDIKGEKRTSLYLMPATKFQLGLFGNWHPINKVGLVKSALRLSFSKVIEEIKKYNNLLPYQKVLSKISRGRIPQEKVPVLYSSSKINLNFTIQDCVDWDTITLRTFEVLACRGFLITDKTPSAQKLLKDCVVFTDGGKDLEEKIEYYLNHPDERQKIAQNGYEYATKCATIDARAKELLEYLKEV